MKRKLSIILIVFSCYAFKNQAQITSIPIMVKLEGGSFTMGNDSSNFDTGVDETPAHSVIANNFSIGKYEVTVFEYKAFCKKTGRKIPTAPEWGWNDSTPIVNVNFDDANAYCNWLSKTTGKKFRLPTEIEWEFAAKGGKKSRGYKYAGSNNLDSVAWFSLNGLGKIHECGKKLPNELGINDLSGNVWEWCIDWYDSYQVGSENKEEVKSIPSKRCRRGGCWGSQISNCRVVNRDNCLPEYSNTDTGFRVVLIE